MVDSFRYRLKMRAGGPSVRVSFLNAFRFGNSFPSILLSAQTKTHGFSTRKSNGERGLILCACFVRAKKGRFEDGRAVCRAKSSVRRASAASVFTWASLKTAQVREQ